MLSDTIAAIVTPPGEGGVGIIRLSGPAAIAIAGLFFRPKYAGAWQDGPGFRLVYGHIVDGEKDETVDEVLLALMRAPRSYTRENVVEIQAHGGIAPLRRILELCFAGGARPAEPGEFTKRAFLNGRLDLAQAEAVLDVIRAKTGDGLRLAVRQLEGGLSRRIGAFRDELIRVLAQIEAGLDFPEEDLPEQAPVDVAAQLKRLAGDCGRLLKGAETGRIYREGLATAIVGKPNVGKSSLLNALLRQNRAIVTSVAGTTRDVIEEYVNIRGIPLRLLDTAGLRETEDVVERAGVARSREAAARADLVILVLDAASGIGDEDRAVIRLVRDKRVVAIVNKVDLAPEGLAGAMVADLTGAEAVVRTVLTEGRGLDELERVIAGLVLGGRVIQDRTVLVTNARHKASLLQARRYLADAAETLEKGFPLEMGAIDVRAALEAFGEITGETITEDLLDRIFADFCIGK